jgi:hypothetical protein
MIAPKVLLEYKDIVKGNVDLNYILQDPERAFNYVDSVYKKRFILGERIISTDIAYSICYAKYVLQGRFELGEKIMATDPYVAYDYAMNLLKERFKLGEKEIAKIRSLKIDYEYNFNCKIV